MQGYQQNYFSWIYVFKDAKSCLIFLFFYLYKYDLLLLLLLLLRDLILCKLK
jgi:hypothetical protein